MGGTKTPLGLSACVVQVTFVGFKSQLLYCAIKFTISSASCLLTRSLSWLEHVWLYEFEQNCEERTGNELNSSR